MDESRSKVRTFYNGDPLSEWNRLDEHPFEFLLTTHMMDRYVSPGDRVLDIGGGPGRYSLYFAEKGCEVTLADLSRSCAEFAKNRAKERNLELRTVVSDCLDLNGLDLGEFDHVFLMGPLYHLKREADRIKAVELALARLKPGGNLYCSFILDFAGVIFDMKNGPGLLPADLANPDALKLLDSVADGTGYAGPGFTEVFLINQKCIEPFMARFGLEKLHLFGQEGILAPNEKQLLAYPKEEIALWVETAKRFLELPELLAFSEHAMFVGRK